jgi:hypothetical protein
MQAQVLEFGDDKIRTDLQHLIDFLKLKVVPEN